MDPNALDARVVLPTHLIPPIGPRVLQLSPFPGNIYNTNCFFYNSATNVSQGDFGAVIAFVQGHPVVVYECPGLQEFQATYPSAIVHPIPEVPPALLEQGHYLFAGGINRALPVIILVQVPLAVDPLMMQMAPLSSVAWDPSNASWM
jgi:hypothetical protein